MNSSEPDQIDLLCAGKLYIDIIFAGLPRFPRRGEEILSNAIEVTLGGGAVICAAGVSSLGLKTGVMGAIVHDLFGDYIVRVLKAHQVNIDSLVKVDGIENNISVSLDVTNDRSMIAFAGIDDYSELDQKKKNSIFSSKHLHVKGLNERRASLLKFAKENTITTSLDINLQAPNDASMIREILRYVDIFLPSAWEVKALFKKPARQMVRELGRLAGEYCVIKLGQKGSIASDGYSLIEQLPNPTKILDATGAGDAFDAGFLWAYLQKEPIEQCLRAGTLAAELCLHTMGGINWINRISEFRALYEAS
jgi:sugar/nucleoside kinase (ribokinase family)